MELSAQELEWLALLGSAIDIFGTDDPDTIAATSTGQIIHGLRANDTLTSAFNRTALLGDQGDDSLSTEFTANAPDDQPLAIQIGGSGADTLTARIGLAVGDVSSMILQSGGGGDDHITSEAFISQPVFGSVVLANSSFAGDGNDLVQLVADLNGGADGIATNFSEGGAGNDRITAFAQTFFFGRSSAASNTLDGGSGDDVLDATAIGHSNSDDVAQNSLRGGEGTDLLRAHTVVDSNSSNARGINELDGGRGNDRLEAFHVTDGENTLTDLTSTLDGGDGKDFLLADTLALADPGLGQSLASHLLLGGSGADRLTSRIEVEAARFTITAALDGGIEADILDSQMTLRGSGIDAASSAASRLEGGEGNDDLSSALTAQLTDVQVDLAFANHLEGGGGKDRLEAHLNVAITGDEGFAVDFSVGENLLFGGEGNDFLLASVEASIDSATSTVHGSSLLHGGGGNDRLTVLGGSGNLLDGGEGNDILRCGSGTDSCAFGASSGRDKLYDFEIGADSFELLNGITITSISRHGQDSLVRFSGGGAVTLIDTIVTDQAQLFTA